MPPRGRKHNHYKYTKEMLESGKYKQPSINRCQAFYQKLVQNHLEQRFVAWLQLQAEQNMPVEKVCELINQQFKYLLDFEFKPVDFEFMMSNIPRACNAYHIGSFGSKTSIQIIKNHAFEVANSSPEIKDQVAYFKILQVEATIDKLKETPQTGGQAGNSGVQMNLNLTVGDD